MTRVVGIDPGTLSIDACGRDGEALFLDECFSTAAVGEDPGILLECLKAARSKSVV